MDTLIIEKECFTIDERITLKDLQTNTAITSHNMINQATLLKYYNTLLVARIPSPMTVEDWMFKETVAADESDSDSV
jgi:hypothetical protein